MIWISFKWHMMESSGKISRKFYGSAVTMKANDFLAKLFTAEEMVHIM
jgi:hypothetical protein